MTMATKPEGPTYCAIRMARPKRPGPRSRCHHGLFLLLLGHKRRASKLVGQPGARASVALHINRSSRCSLSRPVMPVSWKAALRRAPSQDAALITSWSQSVAVTLPLRFLLYCSFRCRLKLANMQTSNGCSSHVRPAGMITNQICNLAAQRPPPSRGELVPCPAAAQSAAAQTCFARHGTAAPGIASSPQKLPSWRSPS